MDVLKLGWERVKVKLRGRARVRTISNVRGNSKSNGAMTTSRCKFSSQRVTDDVWWQ